MLVFPPMLEVLRDDERGEVLVSAYGLICRQAGGGEQEKSGEEGE